MITEPKVGVGSSGAGSIDDAAMKWRIGKLCLPWTAFMGLHVSTELTTSSDAGASPLANLAAGSTECYGVRWSAAGDYIETIIPLDQLDADLERDFALRIDSFFTTADNTATYKALIKGLADGAAVVDMASADGSITFAALAVGTALAYRRTAIMPFNVAGLFHTVVSGLETSRDAALHLQIEADAIEAVDEIMFLSATLFYTRQCCMPPDKERQVI